MLLLVDARPSLGHCIILHHSFGGFPVLAVLQAVLAAPKAGKGAGGALTKSHFVLTMLYMQILAFAVCIGPQHCCSTMYHVAVCIRNRCDLKRDIIHLGHTPGLDDLAAFADKFKGAAGLGLRVPVPGVGRRVVSLALSLSLFLSPSPSPSLCGCQSFHTPRCR